MPVSVRKLSVLTSDAAVKSIRISADPDCISKNAVRIFPVVDKKLIFPHVMDRKRHFSTCPRVIIGE